jgi:hypothetical protein
MPYLMAPSDDPHLRVSFMEAMREHEHEAEDGRADADGLSVRDLSSRKVQGGYARDLSNGVNLKAGVVYWWCESGWDGPEYIGRITFTGGQSQYSVRPSRRGEGHEEAMAEAAAPVAASLELKAMNRV